MRILEVYKGRKMVPLILKEIASCTLQRIIHIGS